MANFLLTESQAAVTVFWRYFNSRANTKLLFTLQSFIFVHL